MIVWWVDKKTYPESLLCNYASYILFIVILCNLRPVFLVCLQYHSNEDSIPLI